MMEVGLHEVMAMAEGMLFRFERTGDRYAPPGYTMQACSIRSTPFWYQVCIRQDADGRQKACVMLHMRHGEDTPSWELWVDDDCRWDGRVYGGRTLTDSEWEIDGAIKHAVDTRNSGLK